MAYVCSFERLGIKKGLEEGFQKGLLQGVHKAALVLLKKGIDEKEIIEELGLTPKQLKALKKKENILA